MVELMHLKRSNNKDFKISIHCLNVIPVMFVEFRRLFLINTFLKRQVNPFYTTVFYLLMTFEPTSLGGLSAQQQKCIMGQSVSALYVTLNCYLRNCSSPKSFIHLNEHKKGGCVGCKLHT